MARKNRNAGAAPLTAPQTREERYLANIAGLVATKPAYPFTRTERYLDSISSSTSGLADRVTALETGKAPVDHADPLTTYGSGSETNFGHVKLSDSTSSVLDTSDGTAATPGAVKSAYDLAAVTGKYGGKPVHVKSFSIAIPSGSTVTELFESATVDTIVSVALIVATPNSNVDTIMGGTGMVSVSGKQIIAQAFKHSSGAGYGLVSTPEATGAEATGTMIVHYTLASGE